MNAVGSPYLPDPEKFHGYLNRIYETGRLSNNGPLVRELEERLQDFLGIRNLLLVANGTLALQVALKALNVRHEAVTTPFTFIATSAALCNEGVTPRFADIDPESLNLSPERIRGHAGPGTSALVPVHVYGNPCDVEEIERIAANRDLAVIYDAAHAFGIDYDGNSILRWGDASVLSFHATKLFHTGEGGGIVFWDDQALERARSLINFGLDPGNGEIKEIGLNAKMSELHAAMGLAVLEDLPDILAARKEVLETYERELQGWVEFQEWGPKASKNGAYAPILLSDVSERKRVEKYLSGNGIACRPYFSPALHETSPLRTGTDLPNATAQAGRALCLPISPGLSRTRVKSICDRIKTVLSNE
ncbi:DegT/DnrJ/EryC1/StrS family aminotransferase [Thiohalorhabdus sp. Cl-TMA]|uniref:DegT/DnrJ/EryC1/StrS family aminotransferase n=1 Tax=Thiohalorhabdus methylotrophus TaxID=3242694 RepID=A0ABV4TUY1_9GAMM